MFLLQSAILLKWIHLLQKQYCQATACNSTGRISFSDTGWYQCTHVVQSDKKKNTFAQKGGERDFSGAQYFNWFAWSIQYQPRCGRRNKNFLPVCLRWRNKQINYNYCPLCPPWYINIKWCKGAYENTWILVNWRGGRAQVALQWTMRRSCLHKHYKVNITHFLKSTFLLECILLLECGVEMVREGPRAAALKTRRGSVTWTLSEGVWLLCSRVLYNNDYSRR